MRRTRAPCCRRTCAKKALTTTWRKLYGSSAMPLKDPQASVAAAEAVDGVVSHPGRSHGPGTGVRRCESTHVAHKKNLPVAWRDVVVRALAAPPPSKQLSMWRQLQLHTEMSGMQPRSKGRGARPNTPGTPSVPSAACAQCWMCYFTASCLKEDSRVTERNSGLENFWTLSLANLAQNFAYPVRQLGGTEKRGQ